MCFGSAIVCGLRALRGSGLRAQETEFPRLHTGNGALGIYMLRGRATTTTTRAESGGGAQAEAEAEIEAAEAQAKAKAKAQQGLR